MQKSELIYMIADNVMIYGIATSPDLQEEKLHEYLNQFDEKILQAIAGFNKDFLEHFLIISKGMENNELKEIINKMEKISYMIGPTGSLNYLSPNQIEYILTKIGGLKLNEISEDNINIIADEQLEKEFGGGGYNAQQALENQFSTASFYLMELGYTQQEIQEKFNEVRQDPTKLDALFNLPPKEIQSLPPEVAHMSAPPSVVHGGPGTASSEPEKLEDITDLMDGYIEQIVHEHPPERLEQVKSILAEIKEHAKENLTDQHERVFIQMHPQRLSRALKMLKDTKKKSKRMPLLIEWFFCSHLIENIEFRVEHWQTSTTAARSATGVYTAGILFSRYDPIIKDFADGDLAKVINITRRILRTPSKNAIQKLGQELTAETGFDEHLYFTD